jgi:hypothetical protein
MTEGHKAALATGRRESRAIKAYLAAIATPKRRGRPVSPEILEGKIETLDEKIRLTTDPLARVDLIQARLDTQAALDQMNATTDMEALEEGFVRHAASYSQRKGITWTAWREIGVPASVLAAAGVKRTRKS